MDKITQLLDGSSGLPAQIVSLVALVQVVLKICQPLVARVLTALADRLDDMIDRGRTDGALVLWVVSLRWYAFIAFLADLLLRVKLPTKASLEERWAQMERARHDRIADEDARGDISDNLDGTGLQALIVALFLGVGLFTGCSTTAPGEKKLDPVEVGYVVEDAAFVGTRVALMKNPEWRPAFEDAVAALVILETDPEISLEKIRAIAATLHVRELQSEKATLLITGADLLLTRLDRGSIDLRKVEWLPPVVAGFRRGLDRALKL